MIVLCRAASLTLLLAAPLIAQTSTHRPIDPCTYERCALGITPSWNALDVVNGATGDQVASLGFFLPHTLEATFAGNDSASFYAARAFAVRRNAAVLTDAGILMLGYAASRQMSGGLNTRDRVIGAIGAGAFAVSVPLQFSADGLLSRAVWWHNGRFAR
jgi:hypothetical protein